MAHNLESVNGKASFVSAREDAWHQLGTVLPDTFTAEQAMEYAHLGGWNVRKAPAFTVDPLTGEMLEMPGRFGIVRDNPESKKAEWLGGDVGSMYHVIQNEEHAEFLNTIVDEGGAHFETAGSINGGRQVFLTMKLPGHMQIGGVDPVDMYLAAMNSHDGSTPFTIMVTPVRVVCQNTLNVALGSNKAKVSFRHTRGAGAMIRQQAREALGLTFKYLDAFQEQAEQLINTTMTQIQFEELMLKAFGPGEDAAPSAVTRAHNKIDEITSLFAEAQTQEGVRDTAWAGFNALTEWYDHFAPTRGEARDTARAINAVLYPEFKEQALKLITAAV